MDKKKVVKKIKEILKKKSPLKYYESGIVFMNDKQLEDACEELASRLVLDDTVLCFHIAHYLNSRIDETVNLSKLAENILKACPIKIKEADDEI